MGHDDGGRLAERARKLKALAEGASTPEEAAAAALALQRLLEGSGMTADDVSMGPDEGPVEVPCPEMGRVPGWQLSLAAVLAQNFRCKTYSYRRSPMPGRYRYQVVFYGLADDATLARDVYASASRAARRLWRSYERSVTDGRLPTAVANTWHAAFVDGLAAAFRDQLERIGTLALAVRCPERVEESYAGLMGEAETMRRSRTAYAADADARHAGWRDGYDTGLAARSDSSGPEATAAGCA